MGTLTRAGAQLRAYCELHKARLLIIDPLAAAYACNENDRGLVRAFMASWDAWARGIGCTVLLVAHPPKSNASYSGSTDWHAAARAVWTLDVQETGTGETKGSSGKSKKTEPAPAPCLKCLKQSYGRTPDALWLESDGGPWRVSQNPRTTANKWAVRISPHD